MVTVEVIVDRVMCVMMAEMRHIMHVTLIVIDLLWWNRQTRVFAVVWALTLGVPTVSVVCTEHVTDAVWVIAVIRHENEMRMLIVSVEC